MDDVQTQDVNQTDPNTEGTPSDTQQTTAETGASETAQTQETADSKYVPYERFSEVNTKLRETESSVQQLQSEIQQIKNSRTDQQARGQVDPETEAQLQKAETVLKPLLDRMGYMSKEEYSRQQQDQALESQLSSLEKEIDGKDGRPAFSRKDVINFCIKNGIGNPKAGYDLMNQASLIDWHVKQAMTKGQGIKVESSNGSGSQSTGTSDKDLQDAMAKGDQNAKAVYLRRVANSVLSRSK